ncbi:MAG: TRAP transporter fused permease subunit [Desulfovibrio sp.]|jgi:TRAP transporter 4TM/12TM fusion protein|nr:TRAP transporter fused permease subunit [Desulfovibrio sp.]
MSGATQAGQSTFIAQLLEKETGRRKPSGFPHVVLLVVPIIWSLFQVWITSPIPYALGVGVFNDTATRSLHLAFGIFLAYLGFPMFKRSPRDRIPLYDWILAFAAAFCAAYLYIFQTGLAYRPGIPLQRDIVVAVIGVVLLLEATRRVMGLPMTIVAIVFIVYVFAGPYAPDLIAHRGASLSRAASQLWLTAEGVFGVPLGVSTSFVFLYVLFGAMLENAGAGNYLTSLSFALLGHLRGGPAKAAVVASGLHGLISGSSIANVLTCGPVTIMLMKKVGFSAEKAGAIEVAAGSNGQIMPPVMGAAAFLMIEYINMPYSQLIKHAFIPALLTYGSLLYIVHLEACKMGLEGLPRTTTWKNRLIGWGLTISALIVLMGAIYGLTAWIPALFGDLAWLVFALFLVAGYLALIVLSMRYPELPEGVNEELMSLPAVTPILFSGLYYLLPIAALVWCLMFLEMSPGLAAFYACSCMTVILLTQRPIVALLKRQPLRPAFRAGFSRLTSSLISGAKNMVGIALATASAGIIVGAISLTGVGQVLAAVVETLSMGSLTLVLLMTAVLALILGMGLPTTANYIIVSTLLAPVIYNLSAAHGLAVPLVAVHLFCLYFGIMADATPPVALAAFAASGISGGDPFQTGVQGFYYEMRTAILPFVFLYNPEILLINIQSIPHLIWVLSTAVLACMAFACATQRFMFTPTPWWEVILLALAVIFLFRPDIPQDHLYLPYKNLPPSRVLETVAGLDPGENIRLHVRTDYGDRVKEQVIVLPVSGDGAEKKLENAGLILAWDGDALMVDEILVDSRVEKLGLTMDDPTQVLGIEVPTERPAKGLFSIPGVILMLCIVATQTRRKRKTARIESKRMRDSATRTLP